MANGFKRPGPIGENPDSAAYRKEDAGFYVSGMGYKAEDYEHTMSHFNRTDPSPDGTMSYSRPPETVSSNDLGIIIVSRTDGVREISLSSFRKEMILVGRDNDHADINIASKTVGRQHGTFRYSGGDFYYYDENSTNGSYYLNNGHYIRIEPNRLVGPLRAGMIFVIGKERIDLGPDYESVLMIITSGTISNSFSQYPLDGNMCTIGRSKDCNIVLNQPAVSRLHARIYPYNGQYVLEDMGSRNGVFVNGFKINRNCYLYEKDIIQIAGRFLIFSCNMLFYKSSISGIQLSVSNLGKRVDHGRKSILSDVNFNLESNEFIAIVGGSGAGKSTLLKALGGYDQDYQGSVMYNGIPLRKYYGILKNIIGYVPQEDIVYENLTLRKMLYYTAEMKMPKGTTSQEINARIQEVLSLVELSEHQNTMIRSLSGGQKKRASIAVELLADPGVFFLDEPTSGLDPGTEQKLMRVLNRLSKTQGKTIVVVTHTTQSLDQCDRIMFMGKGGQLCFLGTPDEALRFFGTDSLVNIYNMLEDNTDMWARRFREMNYAAHTSTAVSNDRIKDPKNISFFKQLGILTRRYTSLTVNDKARILLLFLQPVIIGLLIWAVTPKDAFDKYEPTKQILFTYVCSAIWIGIFNTIQEVCKERPIVKREYMSNLRLTAYVLSKYIVQLVLSFLQAFLFASLFNLLVAESVAGDSGVILPVALEIFFTTWITIYSSSAMGLLVSSMMKNSDRAMAMSPFLLIIQLLFSGVLFELKGISNLISVFTISRWSVESMGNIVGINDLPSKFMLPDVGENMFEHGLSHLMQTNGMMVLFVLVFGLLSIFFLQNVSKDR